MLTKHLHHCKCLWAKWPLFGGHAAGLFWLSARPALSGGPSAGARTLGPVIPDHVRYQLRHTWISPTRIALELLQRSAFYGEADIVGGCGKERVEIPVRWRCLSHWTLVALLGAEPRPARYEREALTDGPKSHSRPPFRGLVLL